MRGYGCVLLTAITLCGISQSFAQSAASSAASATSATVAPAAQAAKPAAKKKTTTNPAKKYFTEVHPLTSTVPVNPNSCFQGPLTLPATNASDVPKLLGSEAGFTVTAIPPNKVAIYYKSPKAPPEALQTLQADLDSLAAAAFDNAIAVRVPTSLGEKALAQLKLPDDGNIMVKLVDQGCVLVLSKDQADPVAVAALPKNIRRLYWGQSATAPTQRLFYIDATTVAKTLSGAKTSGPDTSGSGNGSDASSKPKDPSAAAGGSVTTSSTLSPTVSISVVPGGTAAVKTTTDAGTGGAPDSSSPSDPSAGVATDPTSTAPKTASKTSSPDKSKTPPKPDAPPKPPTMTPVNDMLVYSNDDGSDTGIFERNRLMAVLDLPRPEVLMNIWSLQASSRNYKVVTAEADAARELVAHHNDLLQQAIDDGWTYLSKRMAPKKPNEDSNKHKDKCNCTQTDQTVKGGDFFDTLFYRYITQKFGETDKLVEQVSLDNAPIEKGEERTGPVDSVEIPVEDAVESNRQQWGWCGSNEYCLGFSHAFEPLRPTFTNLLIGVIAAKDPHTEATAMVKAMEETEREPDTYTPCPDLVGDQDPCHAPERVKTFHECMAVTDSQLRTFKEESSSCELDDRIAMTEQILSDHPERLALKCFRRQVRESFATDSPEDIGTTRPGLMRAAVADFLFNYKWATQYPHDFIPYDLTQSAQELNAEFNPLVLAFDRDVSAFTQNLQAELRCRYQADIQPEESHNWFKKGDETFINDGILSVRGISGVNSIADTVTQSFFDATNPPSLTDLVKSVSDAEKNLPGVLKTNLTANEAAVLLGALNSVQPAEAKIGRELKLDITPHALAGASSAELEVKLTAEEVGNPTRYTADKSAEDTLSRVAKHDVTTRVRVESTKLFEISSFSATLQRPRSKFPLLPPLFEVPYFGSFIGYPLSGAQVYHRSTAIVSAVIVPTAADVAFGIDFSADRLCDENGCHRTTSPRDFGFLPLRNFHKAMIACFASGEKTGYTGLGLREQSAELLAKERTACGGLSLSPYLTPAGAPVPPID